MNALVAAVAVPTSSHGPSGWLPQHVEMVSSCPKIGDVERDDEDARIGSELGPVGAVQIDVVRVGLARSPSLFTSCSVPGRRAALVDLVLALAIPVPCRSLANVNATGLRPPGAGPFISVMLVGKVGSMR